MFFKGSMGPIFGQIERHGWLYEMRPMPSSDNRAPTIRNMVKHGLLEQSTIPHVRVVGANHEAELPVLLLTTEGLRVHYTVGHRLPFEHETGWKDYSKYRKRVDTIEWAMVSIPYAYRGAVRDWCIDHDVAVQMFMWRDEHADPAFDDVQTVVVEKRHQTKFLLKWG
jgi:hypothetical protein